VQRKNLKDVTAVFKKKYKVKVEKI